jgi:hypothetical protein
MASSTRHWPVASTSTGQSTAQPLLGGQSRSVRPRRRGRAPSAVPTVRILFPPAASLQTVGPPRDESSGRQSGGETRDNGTSSRCPRAMSSTSHLDTTAGWSANEPYVSLHFLGADQHADRLRLERVSTKLPSSTNASNARNQLRFIIPDIPAAAALPCRRPSWKAGPCWRRWRR